MATTTEMFIGGIALIVNVFVVAVFFFLQTVVVAPIMNRLEQLVTGPQAIPMSDTTYLFPAMIAILLIMDIIIVISYFIISARRTVVDDFY